MNKPLDAQTFYKTISSIEKRELAEQKAREAREKLKQHLPLGEVNTYESRRTKENIHHRT